MMVNSCCEARLRHGESSAMDQQYNPRQAPGWTTALYEYAYAFHRRPLILAGVAIVVQLRHAKEHSTLTPRFNHDGRSKEQSDCGAPVASQKNVRYKYPHGHGIVNVEPPQPNAT